MKLGPIILSPELHPKKWGSELWICNNNEFCGKILRFNKGAQFSAHQHVHKREVFYVSEGQITLMTIDPETAKQNFQILNAGDVVEIPRFLVHQITAITDAAVIEFSTHHEESDSLRVIPGDSQKL